jgi:F-type H+-transporting ATPase subunit a
MKKLIQESTSKYIIGFIGVIALVFSSFTLSAEGTEHGEKEKGFDAGEMIFEHILDAHEWHIMTIGEHHISIPLPIIIYDKEEGGLHMFMSSHLAHGHEYEGYKLVKKDSKSKSKIVRASTGSDEGIMDFSITKTVFAIFISVALMLWMFISIANSYKKRKDQAPKGLQSFMEPLILFIRDDVAKPAIGKDYMRFMPYLLTIFFFIFINNLLGIIPIFPGGSNVNGNIGVTFVMATLTFIITSFNGTKDYWMHIINMPGVPWWLKFPLPLMPIVEIVGVLTKPIVLMIRLFANILAGHIVILGFMAMIFIFANLFGAVAGYGVSVVSVGFTIFLSLLEILVAFIQAYVFTLLSALYFGMAMEKHH